jgi:hypothetical protein
MESEVPDVDAHEQAQEVTPPSTAPVADEPVIRDDEAPEADALEQAQEVPLDDEDEERS